jgi:hypothetical protein
MWNCWWQGSRYSALWKFGRNRERCAKQLFLRVSPDNQRELSGFHYPLTGLVDETQLLSAYLELDPPASPG